MQISSPFLRLTLKQQRQNANPFLNFSLFSHPSSSPLSGSNYSHHPTHLQAPKQPHFTSSTSCKPEDQKPQFPFILFKAESSITPRSKLLGIRGGVEQVVDNIFDAPKVKILKQKMELLGINLEKSCLPGQFHNLFCPKCKGGQLKERSLSFHIISDGEFAMWRCFQAKCGWAGQVFADDKELYNGVCTNANSYRQIAEESLGLEPLGPEVVAYFRERLISEKTLSRNAVRQLSNNKTVIAFTYKQNGLLAGCKYRTMEKRFWQGKGTAKIFYGIDDISQASEIIIVEGEIDKLSLEEAGFRNCVSVPVGAPEKVSSKDLPPIEKDTAFRYLWNCKEYLDKADHIILATDNDPPGQALAEELARRLGRERCLRVLWPKKDEFNSFKDANEVLKYMGADALKKIVENAEPYTNAN